MTTTRVRHLIEVTPDRGDLLVFEFQSWDIGCTQGTTLHYGDTLVGHFRPGTRHWDSALESAERLLAKVVDMTPSGQPYWDPAAFPERFATVMKADRLQGWDGIILAEEWEGEW